MLSFFPRGVLDEILNLIESVSEDFPSYSFILLYNYVHVYNHGAVFSFMIDLYWRHFNVTDFFFFANITKIMFPLNKSV